LTPILLTIALGIAGCGGKNGTFTAGARTVGGEAIIMGPPISDPPKQSQMLKEVTESARDGVSIQASNAEMIAGQLAAAGKQGVPLVAVDIKTAPTSARPDSPPARCWHPSW